MPSTVISSFTYDPETKILRVVYVSGLTYDYFDVPEDIYNAMKTSGAKGIFLNKNIKGNYAFKKVT